MKERFTQEQVATWRSQGGVLIPEFFNSDEVRVVREDFDQIFNPPDEYTHTSPTKKSASESRFQTEQFSSFDAIPFDCSPALNLIGVHPALMAFAKQALATDHVHLYQCQAWAKFTGQADYDQPFHCDYANHTLTVPAEDERLNSITILCYFSDVTEAHGPMHYVTRSDSARVAGPEAIFNSDPNVRHRLQAQLESFERSSAAGAGSIFPYSIDVYHRGTNMTAPKGQRYVVMACYKNAANDSIGYHAWPFHHLKPWHRIFEHATPQQLACFGVHPPGHPFWTDVTLARAQVRYPGWDLTPYRERR